MRRLAAHLGACGLVALGGAGPAEAIAYGGWTAGASLDTYYSDVATSGLTIGTTALPTASQDVGLNAGLTVGNVFVLTPDVDTWVLASAQGRVGAWATPAAIAWSSLFSNTVWRLDGGQEAYALLGATRFLDVGWYRAVEGGLIQPLWEGARGRVQLGGGRYTTDAGSGDFWMPTLGLGLDQAWPTGTSVGVRWAYQALTYATGREPRQQASAVASQRLGGGWEAHLQVLRTFSATSADGYAGTGLGYEF
ncbi:MAG: hypothetical protein VKQ33_00950 [Candidatus Sericytochromatia bacterium]|nr:hypothetical protein [Candidatus Sericytochromatia bacterium]